MWNFLALQLSMVNRHAKAIVFFNRNKLLFLKFLFIEEKESIE